jgi:hypothetical protein
MLDRTRVEPVTTDNNESNESFAERRELFYDHLAGGLDIATSAAASNYWLNDDEAEQRCADVGDHSEPAQPVAQQGWLAFWIAVGIAGAVFWSLM